MRVLLTMPKETAAYYAPLLEINGIQVDQVETGADAIAYAEAEAFQTIVCADDLPDMTPLELSSTTHLPVAIWTDLDDPRDAADFLSGGGAEYCSGSMHAMEVVARLRRAAVKQGSEPSPPMRCAGVTLDTRRHELKVNGELRHLTDVQKRILAYLIDHQGTTATLQAIRDAVWGYDSEVALNNIHVHVVKIRRAIANSGAKITVIRSTGFMMDADDDDR